MGDKCDLYKEAIKNKVKEVYDTYEKKNEKEPQHVTPAFFAQVVAAGATAGGTVGSAALPVIGTIAGVFAGAAVGGMVALGVEFKNMAGNKKIANANKVCNFFEEEAEPEKFLEAVVNKLVDNNQEKFKKLKKKDRYAVADYLTANLFSAIKHSKNHDAETQEDKVENLIEDFKSAKSNKKLKAEVKTTEGGKFSLKNLKI